MSIVTTLVISQPTYGCATCGLNKTILFLILERTSHLLQAMWVANTQCRIRAQDCLYPSLVYLGRWNLTTVENGSYSDVFVHDICCDLGSMSLHGPFRLVSVAELLEHLLS